MFNRVLELKPDYYLVYLNIGRTYEIMDKKGDAVKTYKELIRLAEKAPESGKLMDVAKQRIDIIGGKKVPVKKGK